MVQFALVVCSSEISYGRIHGVPGFCIGDAYSLSLG